LRTKANLRDWQVSCAVTSPQICIAAVQHEFEPLYRAYAGV
jgi:hypothetical protein